MEGKVGKVSQANGRLKVALVRVRIEQIGNRLYLQATLPPKPDSKATKFTQQRIALGLPATAAGLSLAEKEARKVGALLDCKQFDWTPYLSPKCKPPTTVGDWIARLEAEVRGTVADITWETDYSDPFKRLDVDQPLTYELLKDVISATKQDSKTRKRLTQAFGRLAKLAGLDGDFRPLQGNYSARKVEPRYLPTDQEIANFWHKIQNPAWQWVYGMLSTFGLRNHEAFFLDTSELLNGGESVIVVSGKTSKRQVWAYYPEWIDTFNLRSPQLPEVTGSRHADYGDRVTGYLRVRAKMPFLPYDLRHAWAVRTVMFGLPDALAAQQMGHSLTVHNQTYQRWITARDQQQVHDQVTKRSDRPLPP